MIVGGYLTMTWDVRLPTSSRGLKTPGWFLALEGAADPEPRLSPGAGAGDTDQEVDL